MGLSLKNMLGLSSSARIAHTPCSSFCTTHKSSVSTGFAEQIMPILRILCYNGSLVTWTVVSLITAKFKLLIFSTSGFSLSYTGNMFILIILYDFCLVSAQFCYIRMYERLKAVCMSRTGVHLGKVPMVRRTLFCTRCNLTRKVSATNSLAGQAQVITDLN
jgi:hypothetical protein